MSTKVTRMTGMIRISNVGWRMGQIGSTAKTCSMPVRAASTRLEAPAVALRARTAAEAYRH